MLSKNEARRMDVYGWARRHALQDPYDFAIYAEAWWEDKPELIEAAKRWERKKIDGWKEQLEEEMGELRRRIAILDADLERLDDPERWS